MLNESENLEIRLIIIEKIVKKSKEIIDQIQNQGPTEFLKQIDGWLNQIKSESLINDISHFSGILDILSFYLQAEVNNDKKAQIEAYLGAILNNFNQLPPEKIVILTTALNKYAHVDDKDKLEKYLEELDTIPTIFSVVNTTEKKIPIIQKAKNRFNACFAQLKPILNINSSSEFENISLAELPPEPQLASGLKFFSEIDYLKKKKLISSLIYFDKEGKGHRVKVLSKNKKKPRDFFESENLNLNEFIDERQRYENNLEQIMLSFGKEFKRLAEIEIFDEAEASNENLKAQLSVEDKQTELFSRLDSIEKSRAKKTNTRILKHKKAKLLKIAKLWGPAIASIQERISIFKDQQLEGQDILDNFFTDLVTLKGNKNKRLVKEFLNFINYDNLKLLVKIAKETFDLIENLNLILIQIDDVRENLGYPKKYINYFQQEFGEFSRTFFKDFILHYLEGSSRLYKLLKLNSSEFIRLPNYELNIISEKIKFKNPASLATVHSLDEIIANQQQALNLYLKKNYKNNNLYQLKKLSPFLYNTKKNIFTEFFKIIKHFLINFFIVRFYFIDENYFLRFMQKLNEFIEQNQANLTIDSVSNFIKIFNWKILVTYGINPIHLYKKDIKERLVQLLFLSIINQKFQNLIETYTKNPGNNVKNNISDKLFHLIEELGCNYKNNLIENVESRDKVLNKLEDDEEVKNSLRKIPVLASRVHLYRDKLTKLCDFVDLAYESLKKLEDTDTNPEIALLFKNTFFKHPAKEKEVGNLFNPKVNRRYK